MTVVHIFQIRIIFYQATVGPLYHTNQQQQQPSKLVGSQLYGLDRISSTKSENFQACFEVDSKSNNSQPLTVMYYQHLVRLELLDRHYVCRSHDPFLGLMPTFVEKKPSSLHFSFCVFFLLRLFSFGSFLCIFFSDYLMSARVSSCQLVSACVSLLLNLVLPLLIILFH